MVVTALETDRALIKPIGDAYLGGDVTDSEIELGERLIALNLELLQSRSTQLNAPRKDRGAEDDELGQDLVALASQETRS